MIQIVKNIFKLPQTYFISDPFLGTKHPARFEGAQNGIHYYTDNNGFRVDGPGQITKSPADIVFVGASQTEGQGVEYNESFAYKVGKHFNLHTANISIGSFSPLQCSRIFKRHVELLKPKVVFVEFDKNFMPRNFKNNAFTDKNIIRPIYRFDQMKQEIVLEETNYVIPEWVFRLRFLGLSLIKSSSVIERILGKIFIKTIYFHRVCSQLNIRILQKTILRKFGNIPNCIGFAECTPEQKEKACHQNVFEMIKVYAELGKAHGFQTLLHGLGGHRSNPPTKEENQQFEAEVEKIIASLNAESYVVHMKRESELPFYDEWLSEHNLEPDKIGETFYLPNDNHPNNDGHTVIARSVVKQIEDMGFPKK